MINGTGGLATSFVNQKYGQYNDCFKLKLLSSIGCTKPSYIIMPMFKIVVGSFELLTKMFKISTENVQFQAKLLTFHYKYPIFRMKL